MNRRLEMAELDRAARAGGLFVGFGRRRIGKSRLLRHWLEQNGGLYSQAIEGPPDCKLAQLVAELHGSLATSLTPRTWEEFFEILACEKRRFVLCIGEFPYLTTADPSLPSRFQRFLDAKLPKGSLVILAGSSTSMMNELFLNLLLNLFLNRRAPRFGRARMRLRLNPMEYEAFAEACFRIPGFRVALLRHASTCMR